MRINRGLFTSARKNWKTPAAFYAALDEEFHFTFDPCPPDPAFDGLTCEWGARNFCNPPYGREVGKWIRKGHKEWLKGRTVVFLIASRTDTAWWHDYIMQADEIRFIRGRLHFDERGPAPFPSAVVVFRGVAQ